MDHARRPRILLGNLGPIMRMGMRRVLTEQGCEVVGQEDRPSAIVGEVHRLRPDIVVLDLDGGSAHELGRLVRGASPRRRSCSGRARRTRWKSSTRSRRLAPGLRSRSGAASERVEHKHIQRVEE